MSVVAVAPHFEVLRLRIMLFLVPTFFLVFSICALCDNVRSSVTPRYTGRLQCVKFTPFQLMLSCLPHSRFRRRKRLTCVFVGSGSLFLQFIYIYAAGRLTKQAGQDIQFRCTDVFLHQLHACILLVVMAMARVSAKDLPGQSSSFSAYPFFACLRLFLVVAGQQHSSPAVEWIDPLVLSPKSLKFYLHELHTGNRFCWRAKPCERAMLILQCTSLAVTPRSHWSGQRVPQ